LLLMLLMTRMELLGKTADISCIVADALPARTICWRTALPDTGRRRCPEAGMLSV
jgi:hypothetical protein